MMDIKEYREFAPNRKQEITTSWRREVGPLDSPKWICFEEWLLDYNPDKVKKQWEPKP